MKPIALWLARQFDVRVSLAGAVVALLLTATGVGALLALAGGSTLAAIVLGMAFVLILCFAFLAAHHTDPNLRLTKAQKRDRWEKLPAFARRAVYVFAASGIAGVLLEGRLAHLASWVLIAAAALLVAEGIRRERPPLPSAKQGLLAFADSPSEYLQLWKRTLWGFYASAIGSALFALLALR